MIENKQKSLNLLKLLLFYTIFWLIWCIWELFLPTKIEAALGTLLFTLVSSVVKLSVWTIPAIILVQNYKNDVLFSWREMLTSKIKWTFLFVPLGIFAFFNLFSAFIQNGKITVSSEFEWITLIGTVLLVGVTEETVFRGFFLNALCKKMKLWPAIIITATAFLLIHFPIWLYKGIFLTTLLSGGFIIVFALSVLFSWVFVKGKNIIVPIILHMVWNLFVVVLLG